MKIRKATKSDSEELKLVKELLTDEQIKVRFDWQDKQKAVWLVAEEKNKLIGYVVLKWFGKATAPDYPDLEDVFVHPDYRGQGVAGKLVQEAESLAKKKGFKKIGLAVNPDPRCPAHKLYAKLGYKTVNGIKYVDGVYGGVKDWVVDMEKKL